MCSLGGAPLKKNTVVNKMCFVLKINRRGDLARYLSIRGSTIVHVSFCYKRIFFQFIHSSRIEKEFKCLTLSPATYHARIISPRRGGEKKTDLGFLVCDSPKDIATLMFDPNDLDWLASQEFQLPTGQEVIPAGKAILFFSCERFYSKQRVTTTHPESTGTTLSVNARYSEYMTCYSVRTSRRICSCCQQHSITSSYSQQSHTLVYFGCVHVVFCSLYIRHILTISGSFSFQIVPICVSHHFTSEYTLSSLIAYACHCSCLFPREYTIPDIPIFSKQLH